MTMRGLLRGLFLFSLFFVFLSGCSGKKMSAADGSQTLYTRYNIHVQDRLHRNGDHLYRASYANYTDPGQGHIIIPAGSKIEIRRISGREFRFLVPAKNMVVRFEFNERRMGMDVNRYIQKITSPSPVSLNELSALDRKGVAQGKAFIGMSRQGVMTALGYPAAHRTPSLSASTYVYWTNRFGTIAVEFNRNGKVKKVIQ